MRPARATPGSWNGRRMSSRPGRGTGPAYANTLAVGGNVNLRSTATLIGALSDALDPGTAGSRDVMDFLAAPGRLVDEHRRAGRDVGARRLRARRRGLRSGRCHARRVPAGRILLRGVSPAQRSRPS